MAGIYIEPHTLHTHWNAHGKYLDLLHTLFVVKILLSSSCRVNHSIFKDSPGTCARTSLMGADRCVWSEIFFSLEGIIHMSKRSSGYRSEWAGLVRNVYFTGPGMAFSHRKKIIDSLSHRIFLARSRCVVFVKSKHVELPNLLLNFLYDDTKRILQTLLLLFRRRLEEMIKIISRRFSRQ